jgi:serine/threonine protein phosphatase PrpC
LATDGVWEYVTMDDLMLALEKEDLAVAAHVLLDAARIAGSTDNRSVAVIRTTGVS